MFDEDEMKITIVQKLLDRKYFIDNRIQGKMFSWIHDYLKYFCLEHILLMIIHACSRCRGGVLYHDEITTHAKTLSV